MTVSHYRPAATLSRRFATPNACAEVRVQSAKQVAHNSFRRRAAWVFLNVSAALFAQIASAQDVPAQPDAAVSVQANPGRPTVSTPATLTAVGYVQFETGVLGAEKSGEFSNRTGIETVVKLAIAKRIELIAQSEPSVVSDLGSKGDSRPGEVFTGLQTVILHGEGSRPTVSVSYFRRLYASPAPELDIGTNRQSALVLISFDVAKFHVDTNSIVTEQISSNGAHRAQFGQTLSISHPIGWRLGMSGEVWHFTQPLSRSNAVGVLLAPSYTVNRLLVLDGGFNRGLTGTSTRWEGFIGLTYLLPKRLW
jgi:hypothetical protein